jgi:hypothetical protein
MHIDKQIIYRAAHITGPGSVLVSICFGKTPANDPAVVRLVMAGHTQVEPNFDVTRHINEVLSGVSQANEEHGGSLEVQMVQVVPDDYPQGGQAEYAACKIAISVLQGEI